MVLVSVTLVGQESNVILLNVLKDVILKEAIVNNPMNVYVVTIGMELSVTYPYVLQTVVQLEVVVQYQKYVPVYQVTQERLVILVSYTNTYFDTIL